MITLDVFGPFNRACHCFLSPLVDRLFPRATLTPALLGCVFFNALYVPPLGTQTKPKLVLGGCQKPL